MSLCLHHTSADINTEDITLQNNLSTSDPSLRVLMNRGMELFTARQATNNDHYLVKHNQVFQREWKQSHLHKIYFISCFTISISTFWWVSNLFWHNVNFDRNLTGRRRGSDNSHSAATAVSVVVSRCENVRKTATYVPIVQVCKTTKGAVSC